LEQGIIKRFSNIMITNKQDYKYYLEADRIALEKNKDWTVRKMIITNFIHQDYIWDYQKLLRKVEYLQNFQQSILGQIRYAMALRDLDRLSLKLGIYICPNNFGPGLSIAHVGYMRINPAARIGANCRIHTGVTIAAQSGHPDHAPKLGNNVYIGIGATIFGSIEIADNIAIGANSVVNRSFTEPGISIAGIPAKKISDKGSFDLLVRATDIMNTSVENPTSRAVRATDILHVSRKPY
jgi:serine O-acetyltransferase